MSKLSAVRQYIDSRIKEEDSSFRELSQAFKDDLSSRGRIEKSYHVNYSLGTNDSEDGCSIIESGSGEIVLYFAGKITSAQTILDNAMDTSHNIKLRIANPKKWGGDGIKRVQVTNLNAEPQGNNNNIVRVNMDFEFTLASKVL